MPGVSPTDPSGHDRTTGLPGYQRAAGPADRNIAGHGTARRRLGRTMPERPMWIFAGPAVSSRCPCRTKAFVCLGRSRDM
jgi:hypothetical protein